MRLIPEHLRKVMRTDHDKKAQLQAAASDVRPLVDFRAKPMLLDACVGMPNHSSV